MHENIENTHIFSGKRKDEVLQEVKAVINAGAPSLFHQGFHCLKRTSRV